MAIDGTKIPAGTLQPYDMMTRKMRRMVATASDITIDQRFLALQVVSTCYANRRIPLTRTSRYSRALPRIPGTRSPSSPSC